jgi:8-oxo-dGTP pyrophosphatase MutT (NUDIX family)
MTEKIHVVKTLIRDEKGRFLAVQDRETGRWEVPGGKIENRENRFQAAKREVSEEVNLKVSDLKELVRIEVEGFDHVDCWVLYSENFSGEIALESEEISEFEWVTADEFYRMDWKIHAGYDIPVMKRLEEFL